MTFIFMRSINLSIDAISLFALILVLGIVVDDAIVVLENIYRYLEDGSDLRTAAIKGSREVLAPVLASVTTTMVAFLPILIVVGGIIGRYLSILPKVVIFTLSASVFEAYFMMPSHVVELTPKNKTGTVFKKRFDVFIRFAKFIIPIFGSFCTAAMFRSWSLCCPPFWRFFCISRPILSCLLKAISFRALTFTLIFRSIPLLCGARKSS